MIVSTLSVEQPSRSRAPRGTGSLDKKKQIKRIRYQFPLSVEQPNRSRAPPRTGSLGKTTDQAREISFSIDRQGTLAKLSLISHGVLTVARVLF